MTNFGGPCYNCNELRDELLNKTAKFEAERDMYKKTAFQAQEMAKEIAQSKESWRLRCMNADDEANKHAQENEKLVAERDNLKITLESTRLENLANFNRANKYYNELAQVKADRAMIVEALNSILKQLPNGYEVRITEIAREALQKIGEVKE